MVTNKTVTALVLAFSLAAPVIGYAAETPPKAAVTQDVEAQLKALKKAVGSGEISGKDYQKRKEALLAGTSQTAKATPK